MRSRSKTVQVLTIPHSGTRYVHALLNNSGLKFSGPTDPYPDRDGHVLHWHATQNRKADAPTLGVLREPLAMFVSHFNRPPNSRLPTEAVHAARIDEITTGWEEMLKDFYITPFVRVEFLNGQDTSDRKVLKHMLQTYLQREVELNFEGIDKARHATEYPLKTAYRNRDYETCFNMLPEAAVELWNAMPDNIRRLYRQMYHNEWLALESIMQEKFDV